MSKIKMCYSVPDVEHMGDVNSEIYELTKLGAEDITTDIRWGEEEIEEAYIFFTCTDDKFEKFKEYGAYIR